MLNFIREKIENYKRQKEFNAQNCVNRQSSFKTREEKRLIEEDKRKLNDLISEIENRINFVVNQSFNQQTVIFQVDEQNHQMFEKAKEHFVNKGFNAFFQKLENLPVEALVISWM